MGATSTAGRLTDGGALLSRIYSEADLLVAEALRTGVLDDVTPAELAALVSCFTYERRGPDAERVAPPVGVADEPVAQRARDLRRICEGAPRRRGRRRAAGDPPPDPGLADAMHAWASGDALADVLDEDDELTGGDFVRNVKQVVDLLRQIATRRADRRDPRHRRRGRRRVLPRRRRRLERRARDQAGGGVGRAHRRRTRRRP